MKEEHVHIYRRYLDCLILLFDIVIDSYNPYSISGNWYGIVSFITVCVGDPDRRKQSVNIIYE